MPIDHLLGRPVFTLYNPSCACAPANTASQNNIIKNTCFHIFLRQNLFFVPILIFEFLFAKKAKHFATNLLCFNCYERLLHGEIVTANMPFIKFFKRLNQLSSWGIKLHQGKHNTKHFDFSCEQLYCSRIKILSLE